MATYSDWQQRQLDQASAAEMDRAYARGRPAGMKRSRGQWENMKPEAVCAGSPAQILFCVQDAQHDIMALLAEVERLKTELMRRVVPL